MSLYFVFLRAINVGGHNVKMADLREIFISLGFRNVETYIASGNVIFESDDNDIKSLENKIERHLFENLGYEVAVFIRTANQLKNIVYSGPVTEEELESVSALNIAFWKNPLDKKMRCSEQRQTLIPPQ